MDSLEAPGLESQTPHNQEITTPAEEPVPPDATPDSQNPKWELALREITAVALVGTLALSAIATKKEGDFPGFVSGVKSALIGERGHSGLEGHRASPNFGPVEDPVALGVSNRHEQTKTVRVPGTKKRAVIRTDIKNPAMPWAEGFSQDPEATDTRLASETLDTVISRIQDYEQRGYSIEGISVKGFASDEDNGPNAGLGRPSEQNRRLADTRAKAVEKLLTDKLQKDGIGNQVKVQRGEEVIDPTLNQEIEAIAGQKGESVLSLVQRYNRDRQSFSAKDLKILDGLAGDRFVRVSVILKGSEERQVTTTKAVAEHHGGSIIIVPFLIPLFRRRREEEETESLTEAEPLPEPESLPEADVLEAEPLDELEVLRSEPLYGVETLPAARPLRTKPLPAPRPLSAPRVLRTAVLPQSERLPEEVAVSGGAYHEALSPNGSANGHYQEPREVLARRLFTDGKRTFEPAPVIRQRRPIIQPRTHNFHGPGRLALGAKSGRVGGRMGRSRGGHRG